MLFWRSIRNTAVWQAGCGSVFVLGGIVVPKDFWAKIAADLRRLKSKYGMAGEIKWRYFATRKGGETHSLRHLEGALTFAFDLPQLSIFRPYWACNPSQETMRVFRLFFVDEVFLELEN